METFLIKAAQLILSLSILVFLHELGHFAFARLFKTRVDKFYLFFNPYFSLLRCKKVGGQWKIKFFARNVPEPYQKKLDAYGNVVKDEKGKDVMEEITLADLPENDWRRSSDTEWGIGWLPLGGYCKISGMIDESMDTEALKKPAQPWEFRSKTAWQRLLIMIGGVTVNFITALAIYSMILLVWGEQYLPLQNAKYGMQFTEVARKNGFKNGDIIVSINDKATDDAAEAIKKMLIDGSQKVEVLRDGQKTIITLPADFTHQVIASNTKQFMTPRIPFVVEKTSAGTAAAKAGLQKGDSVVSVNGKPMFAIQDVTIELDANKGKTLPIEFVRAGQHITIPIQVNENGKLGVVLNPVAGNFQLKKVTYGFFESIPAGINRGVETLVTYVKQLKFIFTKEGAKQVGGFGTIGSLFPDIWDWQSFWALTAFLSIILAFMNILPIPALDGGHTLFLLYEMITGRKPSDKFLEYAQMAGFFLLLALLVYANGNDIFRLFK